MATKGKEHHSYRRGGRTKKDESGKALPVLSRSRSWQPGQSGQGGQGLNKGYGGSRGQGTGPAGPEDTGGLMRPRPAKRKR